MGKTMRTQDDVTRDILNKIRVIQENKSNTTTLKLLNEEVETSNDIMAQIEELQSQIDTLKSKIDDEDADMDSDTEAIAITDEPKFGQNALTNQIQQFRSSVESGCARRRLITVPTDEGLNCSSCSSQSPAEELYYQRSHHPRLPW